MSTAITLREGDVLTYTSDRAQRGDRDAYWCLEGMAVVDDSGHAFDTFWATGSDAHRLTKTELATAVVLFNVADYRELSRHEAYTWETYHPDARQQITSQHRLQRRLFVLADASPDLETKIANARRELDKAHDEVKTAVWHVEQKARELARLEAQR